MRQNRFNSDLDELFAPASEPDPFWVWANVAFWASMLALLVGFWGWAVPHMSGFWEWVMA